MIIVAVLALVAWVWWLTATREPIHIEATYDEWRTESETRETRTDAVVAEYLARKEREDRERVPYIKTHGPWNVATRECLRCGRTELDIHHHQASCQC